MRKFRDLCCGLALAGFTAILVWSIVQVAGQEFPEQADLPPLELRHWLTQQDLSQADAVTRSRVVRRFEEQLRGGGDGRRTELGPLEPQERQQLMANVPTLLEGWFRDKTNRYFEQKPERREAWLDGQLGQLEQAFGQKRGGGKGRSLLDIPGALYVLGMIGNHMEQWIVNSEPKQQERMREFQRALQERLLARR